MTGTTKQVGVYLKIAGLRWVRVIVFPEDHHNCLSLFFRQTIRVECSGMFVFILLLFASAFHVSNFSFLLRKGKLRVLFL